MTQAAENICALCQHFKMKEYPKHAEVGIGRCSGYDGTFAPLIKPFIPWATPACTRYRRATNMEARIEWVGKQKGKQQPTSTALPAWLSGGNS